MVSLPFVTSNLEWLEREWRHGSADELHETLGAHSEI